jgi:hypothetical protein
MNVAAGRRRTRLDVAIADLHVEERQRPTQLAEEPH